MPGRSMPRKRLGEILLDEGLITEDQLNAAIEAQKKSGGLLGEILVEMGAISERDIARAIVLQNAWPYLSVFNHYISREMLYLFPESYLWEHQFIPLDRFLNTITIVSSNVLSDHVLSEIEQRVGCKVKMFAASASEIRSALATYCPVQTDKTLEQVFPESTSIEPCDGEPSCIFEPKETKQTPGKVAAPKVNVSPSAAKVP